jgi:hypothetical protein
MAGNRPPEQYYRDAEQRDFLVMRVCMYLRGGEPCRGCPQWEHSPVRLVGSAEPEEDEGKVKRMCRAMAEELIAVVHSKLDEGPEVVAQDNEPWPPVTPEQET